MVRPLARRRATSTLAALVAITGLATTAHADEPDPYQDAGGLVGWATGSQTYGSEQVPTALDDVAVAQVDAGQGYTLAVDANGKLTCFGESSGGSVPEICGVPDDVADGKVASVAAGVFSNAGAVMADGSVSVWGQSALKGAGDPDAPWPTKVPSDLQQAGGAKQLSIGASTAAAVTPDGRVRAWGSIDDTAVPSALKEAGAAREVAVTAYGGVYVLKTDGSVTVFGADDDVPAAVKEAGSVKQLVPVFAGAYALTTQGRVVAWGSLSNSYGTPEVPAAIADATVERLGGHWGPSIAITDSDDVVAWDCQDSFVAVECPQAPDSIDPATVTALTSGGDAVLAIVRDVRAVAAPTVSGTPKVGTKLTGTAGTFSGGGTVTNQWLAGDEPIEGATDATFTPTSAQVGKTLSLRSTSTKGDVSRSSTSTATAAVTEAAATTVTATATASRYGTSAPKVTVTLAPTTATGSVEVWSGSTRLGTGTATSGKATVTWSSRTALGAGRRTLTVKYLGDDDHKAGQTTTSVTVAKAVPSVVAKSATTKIKAKKTRAKVAVTVRATGTTPTGTATVYLGRTKVGSATLRGGKATVTLKAFRKKGKQTLTIRYNGSANVNAAAKSLKVTVKR